MSCQREARSPLFLSFRPLQFFVPRGTFVSSLHCLSGFLRTWRSHLSAVGLACQTWAESSQRVDTATCSVAQRPWMSALVFPSLFLPPKCRVLIGPPLRVALRIKTRVDVKRLRPCLRQVRPRVSSCLPTALRAATRAVSHPGRLPSSPSSPLTPSSPTEIPPVC